MKTPQTMRVKIRMAGMVHETTLADVIRDNDFEAAELATMVLALAQGEKYQAGGGADAAWSIEAVKP